MEKCMYCTHHKILIENVADKMLYKVVCTKAANETPEILDIFEDNIPHKELQFLLCNKNP